MCCTLGAKDSQELADDVFRNLFHQGNSLLSPIEGNKAIYQRYVGLLHQCSLGLHLGDGSTLCDRITADGTYNSLCYWLHGMLNHACQLLLHWHTSRCPCCQYSLSPGFKWCRRQLCSCPGTLCSTALPEPCRNIADSFLQLPTCGKVKDSQD